MSVARITGPGLAGIGLSVALLWGCFISERVMVRRASREEARALHEIELLRQRQQARPAAAPIPHVPRSQHATAS